MLRAFFANIDNFRQFVPPNIDPKHYLNLKVYDTEPESLRSFPMVVISGSNGQMVTSGLSDFAQEIYDEYGGVVGYRYHGIFEFNITCEIGTREVLDREVLTDLVTMAFRHFVRRKVESHGVLIKSMNYGNENVVPYDTNHIYISTINMATFSEWYEDVELLPIDKVQIDMDTTNS